MSEYWNSTSLLRKGIPLGKRLITETEIKVFNRNGRNRLDWLPDLNKNQIIDFEENLNNRWFLFEKSLGR